MQLSETLKHMIQEEMKAFVIDFQAPDTYPHNQQLRNYPLQKTFRKDTLNFQRVRVNTEGTVRDTTDTTGIMVSGVTTPYKSFMILLHNQCIEGQYRFVMRVYSNVNGDTDVLYEITPIRETPPKYSQVLKEIKSTEPNTTKFYSQEEVQKEDVLRAIIRDFLEQLKEEVSLALNKALYFECVADNRYLDFIEILVGKGDPTFRENFVPIFSEEQYEKEIERRIEEDSEATLFDMLSSQKYNADAENRFYRFKKDFL